MSRFLPSFPRWKKLALPAVAGTLLLGAMAASAQQPPPARPMPGAGPGTVIVQPPAHPIPPPAAGCCDTRGHGGHGGPGGHFVLDSMFGPADCSCWAPLCHGDLLTGWTEPWARPPVGSGGAPREHWLNTADGFFTREFHFFYFRTDNIAKAGDSHVGLFQWQTPLSRRLWVSFDVPLVGLTGFGGAADTTRAGDLTITPKVLLTETQDLSVAAGLAVRTPTGTRPTGDDLFILTPFVAAWTDLGGGFSLRSGLGVEVPINDAARAGLADATLLGNLAIGQTLGRSGAFGSFSYYLALNVRQDLGTTDEHTFLSLTPGVRAALGGNWFVLAAYEVPLVGPRGFDQRFLAGLIKAY